MNGVRKHVENVRGLPADFPGTEILAIPFDEDESSTCSVYVSTSFEGTPTVFRLNLFAELLGIRQHIASAFVANVPRGFSGLVMAVTGFLVDGWHLYAQAATSGGVSSANATIRATMAARPCCTDPFVRVPEPLLALPLAELIAGNVADMIDPPMLPLGGPNGQIVPFSVTADSPASPLVFPPGSRLVEISMLGTGEGNLVVTFVSPSGVSEAVTVAPKVPFQMFFEEEPKAIASLAYSGGATEILGHVVR